MCVTKVALRCLLLVTHKHTIFAPLSGNPLNVVDCLLFKICCDLAVVFADMLCVPAIAPTKILSLRTMRKGSRSTLQRDIPCTHDSLPDILETVIHVPRHLYRVDIRQGVVMDDRHCVESVEYRVQTMQLVRHRRRKHRVIDIVVYWLWEIVMPCRILNFDIAQSFCCL